jgi:hypothetical protein
MEKYKLIIVALFVILVGCANTSPSASAQKLQPRKPLSPDAAVTILFASYVPLVPENAEFVTTMQNGSIEGKGCSEEEGLTYFQNTARDLGANFVFVKNMGTYRGTFNTCVWFLVDLYYLPGEADK